MRGARASGAGKGSEWSWGLREVMCGGLEDTVVVDGGDIGVGGRFGLRQKESRSEEECGGLRAEDTAGGCHGD